MIEEIEKLIVKKQKLITKEKNLWDFGESKMFEPQFEQWTKDQEQFIKELKRLKKKIINLK